jgi:hypothetical protein
MSSTNRNGEYPPVQFPFDNSLTEMSKRELRKYFEWFTRVIPERIGVLSRSVRSTPGFESWQEDYTADSLNALGSWFAAHIEVRPRTQEEREEVLARLAFPVEVPESALSPVTFAICFDVGMYLSQVFIKNHASLHWGQEFLTKRYIHNGKPVILGFSDAFEPVWMMLVLANRIVNGKATGLGLRELYDTWIGMIPKEPAHESATVREERKRVKSE